MKISERLNKVGNVLVHEYKPERRYCREVATVTYATAGTNEMQVGEVLILDTGKYRELVSGDDSGIATATLGILIDDTIEELQAVDLAKSSPTGSVSAAILTRGPAAVKLVGINAGAADIDGVIANLEAAGIDVSTNASVKTASRLS